ncbi:PPOX class F420-dependent oxidoreductase [Ornithinimicrobium faecis]|uniref:PPOX class F420-dependent oxidoreductase n=1 Tax=Ornithinimicrobium faecis TaxID=2934158 RepID=A0ABY4YWG6_9MICO|nr:MULTISPECIES: PPOX class F420-dependent oxidoreductase [unclassified Ornithinimicrobium]USQ81112.1 PPOX class F420-dependent oxidoreductase [Ornithinimicrobium sp. HY1793]
MALTDAHRDFLTAHKLASLATIKRDGRPQLSQVSYHFDPGSDTFRISITATRAKFKNLQRDPRATLLVAGGRWEYLVVDGDASFSEVTTDPHDAAGDALVDLYRTVAGEHPDWDEYRAAMVAEQRVVLSVVATHSYGILPA